MDNTSFSLSRPEMLSIIRKGLPQAHSPLNIIIVGAGMAGLVSASLLKAAGHNVTILEAADLIGGRVFTLRSPFTHGHYLEAGAMRIPHTHDLTLAYVTKFGLPLQPFINNTTNDIISVNGIKTRRWIYQRDPDILRFPVAPHEKGRTFNELAGEAIKPVIDFIKLNPATNWPIVVQKYDRFSMDQFMRFNPVGPSLSVPAIDMIKVMTGFEGFPELAFPEILRDFILFDPSTRFYEIAGGFDQLPQAFLPQLHENIYFQHKMTRIVQTGNQITISGVCTHTDELFQMTGDIAIVTIPFTVLQFVQVEPYDLFSYQKWKAIRQLHYVSSSKIGVQFSQRFWEAQGIKSGQTVTDSPIRLSYFPSHGFDQPGGVVLVSYTWEDDDLPWLSMSKEEQIMQAVKLLADIHGEQVYSTFVTGITHNWALQPYAAGAFALFKPLQETEFSPYIGASEGRIYFAGEHTSNEYHGWIQGAIESAVRVAVEVGRK
ncbi:flavin monoamine oxidase family protein [Brevibacillus fortis]|uniref:Amine oxidase n=1 Tax=Brevibacillus fortis TaxID=2126352 RepID=A0A2P7V2M3_9BACL|nr:flavin monoamine oxidase family protein [Brevibacillus fortis]PSJ93462.1 amine oxidase [Brevibacillus fortis]